MKAELEAAQAALAAVTKEKEDAKQASRLAKLTWNCSAPLKL